MAIFPMQSRGEIHADVRRLRDGLEFIKLDNVYIRWSIPMASSLQRLFREMPGTEVVVKNKVRIRVTLRDERGRVWVGETESSFKKENLASN